jgi:hypothetical protein
VGHRLFLALLILSVLVSGCISKPQETQAPPDAVDDEGIEELPVIEDVTEEELAPEVDLEINDTVDLGSLL